MLWLNISKAITMKNDLKTVVRLLRKDKSFFLINLTGLAIGIASFLVIIHFVVHHTTFDQGLTNGDRLFRLVGKYTQNGEDRGVGTLLPGLLAPTLSEEQAYVQQSARFYSISYNNNSIIYKDETSVTSYDESNVYLVDKAIFELFDWQFRYGSAAKFNEPMKMVLTESTARKYFQDTDPVGKEVTLAGNTGAKAYEIVGIIDDLPEKSHMTFDVLVSYESRPEYFAIDDDSWGINTDISYFLLDDGARADQLKIDAQALMNNKTAEVEASTGYRAEIIVEPIPDIHLFTTVTQEDFKASMDYRLVYGLAVIAIIIVLIAWINYLNLSMVKTLERTREVGVRKVLGAGNNQIARLFVIEAVLVVVLAFIIALTVVQYSSPFLEQITALRINTLDNLGLVSLIFIGLLASACLVGFYPSLLIRSQKSFEALRGKNRTATSGISLRKILITVQFVVSFLLIGATLTVYYQLTYMKSADLGLDIEDIMVIKSPPSAIQGLGESKRANYNSFKNDLSQYPVISKFTNGGELPGKAIDWRSNTIRLKSQTEDKSVMTNFFSMGVELHDFFGIDLIAGRYYDKTDNPFRTGEVVINQRMSESLGFDDPEEAVGQELAGFFAPLRVVGVVANHHHGSLHSDYLPIIYMLSSWTEYYFVKFALGDDPNKRYDNLKEAVQLVEASWGKSFPSDNLDYFFLDESFNEQYFEDERFGKIFTLFSVLAIIIASLGLFGLFSYTIKQKTKEIGIRKVLGATGADLILLLSRGYYVIILLAYAIAMPLAWYFSGQWLDNYSFRIDVGHWLFTYPLAIVVILATTTILWQLRSSLRDNPVDSLRYE